MLSTFFTGLIALPWWGYIVVLLALTQITIFAVTVYLHRCQAHRSLNLHPAVSHFFRFWLWMTTGMVTKEWAAIHRKHHAKVETAEDPHSPQAKGLRLVFWEGAELYRKEAANPETLQKYGEGTPDDWIERHVYTKHSGLGILMMLAINLILFGALGLTIWALQMAWIPFFAAGVVNGIGHYWGYRNYECKDASRNILPLGLFIGGEELHNNHHAFATSAKFSTRWWEIDSGWVLIKLLSYVKLAEPKRTIPKLMMLPSKKQVDVETLKTLIANRFQILSQYTREVILTSLHDEKKRAGKSGQSILARAKTVLVRDASLMKDNQQKKLAQVLNNFQSLQVVYQFRLRLQEIWSKSTASQKELLEALQEWCAQAESTGIEALTRFTQRLKTMVREQYQAMA